MNSDGGGEGENKCFTVVWTNLSALRRRRQPGHHDSERGGGGRGKRANSLCHGHEIQAGEMKKREGERGWERGRENSLCLGHEMGRWKKKERESCFHQATGERYVPPPLPPPRAEFTRMVQHQLIIPSLPPPFGDTEWWKSLPQNLWHFLMACQGRMSQHCWTTPGEGGVGGGRGFRPWVWWASAFIWACAFASLWASCAAGCKLQAREWKSGILKAPGK